MRLRSRGCFLTLTLALAICACGEDEPSPPPVDPTASDEEQIAATVNGFFAAVVGDDGESACSVLTERGQRLMHTVARREFPTEVGEGADCVAVVAIASEYLEDGEQPGAAGFTYVADDVSIEEGRSKAYVRCEFRGSIFMERSEGDWLIELPACID